MVTSSKWRMLTSTTFDVCHCIGQLSRKITSLLSLSFYVHNLCRIQYNTIYTLLSQNPLGQPQTKHRSLPKWLKHTTCVYMHNTCLQVGVWCIPPFPPSSSRPSVRTALVSGPSYSRTVSPWESLFPWTRAARLTWGILATTIITVCLIPDFYLLGRSTQFTCPSVCLSVCHAREVVGSNLE